MARIFIIAIVALTYFFSLFEQRRVFTLGVWCFSGFSSLFPLVFASLYWKRLTKAGAYACIITAITLWVYLFWRSDFAAIANFTINFGGDQFMSFTKPGEHLSPDVIKDNARHADGPRLHTRDGARLSDHSETETGNHRSLLPGIEVILRYLKAQTALIFKLSTTRAIELWLGSV